MKNKCSLCNVKFEGYGHNPDPLSSWGRCCDKCNNRVIEYRIYRALRDR